MFRPVVQHLGLELVDVEWVPVKGGRRLGVYISRPSGRVGLDDCEQVATALDAMLEETADFSDAYTLEVSSPGLDRVLRRPEEYDVFAGRTVAVYFKEAVDGRMDYEGELLGRSGNDVVLKLPSGGSLQVPLSNINKAKLVFKLK